LLILRISAIKHNSNYVFLLYNDIDQLWSNNDKLQLALIIKIPDPILIKSSHIGFNNKFPYIAISMW